MVSKKTVSPWGQRLAIAVIIVLVVVVAFHITRRIITGSDRFAIEHTQPRVSQVDGMQYRVHETHANPQKAADTLATINARVIDFMRVLRARYIRGPAGDNHPARRKAVSHLLARYNPDNLAENSPNDPAGDTSYTLDKGAVVALCLRERDPAASGNLKTHDIHDLDTLMFVALHEMGHIAVDVVDHPPRFWSAFRFLLDEAESAGIFTSPNYHAKPRTYCGVRIDYSPRWDPTVVSI